jgi:UDP:flavonoid glycosyltransferase YjiC (YdhE family)
LTDNKIDLVISDVASLPMKAAGNLKIPAILIGNFTWHDIYSHLPEAENQAHLIQALAEEYSHTPLQILPQCHLNNKIIHHKKEVGFIANNGKNVRNELISFLGKTAENKTLIFIYLGEHGTHAVNWNNLRDHNDCLFLTRDPIKHPDVHFLDEKFSYHDLIASSDIILTKGGYSTLATAFANHKPVITCERDDFYEFEAVREYLQNRQIGIIVKSAPFNQGDWQEPIKEALKLTVKNKVPLNGEIEIAEIVQQMLS